MVQSQHFKYPQSDILMKTSLGPSELSKISKQKYIQVCWKVRASLSRPTSQIWYFWNKTCAHSSSHSHKLINQILLNLLLKQNLGPLELSKFSSHMYLKLDLDLAACLTFDPFSETKNGPFRSRQVKNWATYILLSAFGFTKHPCVNCLKEKTWAHWSSPSFETDWSFKDTSLVSSFLPISNLRNPIFWKPTSALENSSRFQINQICWKVP